MGQCGSPLYPYQTGYKGLRALIHWTGGPGLISLESFYVGAEGPGWESPPAGQFAEAGPEGLA